MNRNRQKWLIETGRTAVSLMMTLMMVLTATSMTVSAAETVETVAASGDAVRLLVPPYLQITGTDEPGQQEMSVCFVTDRDSLGRVEFSEGDTLGDAPTVVYEAHHGLRQNGYIFRIPLRSLKPDSLYTYRVAAKEITQQQAYRVDYGTEVESGPYTFRTLAATKPNTGPEDAVLTMAVFNDIHSRWPILEKLWEQVENEPINLVLLNGDIIADPADEAAILRGLKTFSDSFAARIPTVYVRGNHETRGPMATRFRDYMAYPSAPFYFDFSASGVRLLVVDFGEDKPDDEAVYGGLNDFDTLRTEEAAWLAEAVKRPEFIGALARIVCCHAPTHPDDGWHGTGELREKFSPIYNESGVNLYLAGHTHEALITPAGRYPDEKDSLPNRYAIATGDGPDEKGAVVQLVTVFGNGRICVKQIRSDGTIREESVF